MRKDEKNHEKNKIRFLILFSLQLIENKTFEKNEKNEKGFSKIPQNRILSVFPSKKMTIKVKRLGVTLQVGLSVLTS